jgi:tripartite-type tricarboxylate transporter receptor subunit TctC
MIPQPMVIANTTGAGGAVAYTRVRNDPPDGYSLVWSSAAMATLPAQGNIDFDYRAFDHIAMVSQETVTLVVAANSPWQTFEDFIAHARQEAAQGRPVTVGNSGVGSYTHLSAAAIASRANTQFQHIAFGAGLAVTNLLGGHIDASVQHPAEILSVWRNNQVRILSVSSEERIPAFRDVPTLMELGLDLHLAQWRSVSAPRGTSPDRLRWLEDVFLRAADDPRWHANAEQTGSTVVKMGSEELTQFFARQHELIAELATDIQAELKK